MNNIYKNQFNLLEQLHFIDIDLFTEELNDNAKEYLNNRSIFDYTNIKYCKNDIYINGKFFNTSDMIIFPFKYSEKLVYGFVGRKLKEKDFVTYLPYKIYNVYNWFKIDINKPVYIFEGIIDLLSIKNINGLACCCSDINSILLSRLKEPIMCLDNDATGLKKMKSYAKLYNNLKFINYENFKYKDMNEALINGELDFNNFNFINSVELLNYR